MNVDINTGGNAMNNFINGNNALKQSNVIEFPKPKRKTNNYKVDEKQEVYPFKTEKDLKAMRNYFVEKKHYRDELMFILGINIGLRAGDLLSLRWNQVLREDKTVYEEITVKEEKTDKFRTFYLNNSCTAAITAYFERLSSENEVNLDSYIFSSRKGNTHIQVRPACNILKTAAKSVGIEYNVGTHSLRKTFGYHQLKAHADDALFLCELQEMFGHSSPKITLRYCGLENEKMRQYYNDVNLL